MRIPVVVTMMWFAMQAVASLQSLDDAQSAKNRFGPLYMTPSFALREFGVDTNVFNNADEKSDFTFTLAPHVDVWAPLARRALLKTSVTTDLVYYHTYASERSFDPNLRLRGDVFLNRITLYAEPSYLRTRQRLSYELDARAQRQERGIEGGIKVRLSPRLGADLSAGRTVTDFDAGEIVNGTELRDTLNRETRSVAVALRHELTPLTTMVLRVEEALDRFEFAPIRDANSLRVTPGVVFEPRALVSGSAYVGVRSFTPKSADLPRYRGLVVKAALSLGIGEATRVGVDVDRDISYSYEPTQPYYVIQGFRITADRRLVGRTDIRASVLRHRYSYRNLSLANVVSGEAGREDVVQTWSSSFGYRFARETRVGVGVSYVGRESSDALFRDYSGLRLAATVDYGL